MEFDQDPAASEWKNLSVNLNLFGYQTLKPWLPSSPSASEYFIGKYVCFLNVVALSEKIIVEYLLTKVSFYLKKICDSTQLLFDFRSFLARKKWFLSCTEYRTAAVCWEVELSAGRYPVTTVINEWSSNSRLFKELAYILKDPSVDRFWKIPEFKRGQIRKKNNLRPNLKWSKRFWKPSECFLAIDYQWNI